MKPIPDPEAEAHKSALILVVDDEEPARHLLARILEEYGYRCNVASDAREARSLLAENEYSLVLTDMDMPGESGLDLITDIAVNSPDIGTIMVTGRGHHDLATRVISSGAYGYISKPIDPDEVYVNVLNALRRRSLQLENRKHRERLEELVKHRTDELSETCMHLERSKKEVQASRE